MEFSVTDGIAMGMGLAADSDQRLQAAVTFELSHNENNGHVFLPRNKLIAATAQLLDCGADLVEQALRKAGREDLIGFGKECLIKPGKAGAGQKKQEIVPENKGRKTNSRRNGRTGTVENLTGNKGSKRDFRQKKPQVSPAGDYKTQKISRKGKGLSK